MTEAAVEPATSAPRWGLGDAFGGWIAIQVWGLLFGALVLAATGHAGEDFDTIPLAVVALAQGGLALGMWAVPRFRNVTAPAALAHLSSPQWIATIGADIICFTALHLLSPATSLNYGALLVLPVLMAGVLTPRLIALATAAIVSIALLAVASLSVLGGGDTTALMTQAGLL